jgi:hypothetical protein
MESLSDRAFKRAAYHATKKHKRHQNRKKGTKKKKHVPL